MSDHARTRMRLAAILMAGAMAVTLGGCAGDGNSAGDTSSSGENGANGEPGTDDPTGNGEPGEPNLADLDPAEILAIGLDGGAAITCGYTFDAEELEGIRMLSPSGWTTPEATIHVDGTTAHWEVPQEDNRLSHILYHEGVTYTWKVPGDGGGAKSNPSEDTSLGVLADQMRKNAHDCVAFTGSPSMFTVPTDREFTRFEDLGQ